MEGHSGGQCPFLPQHIFEEILSRLPLKHLIRFKSVCRSWSCLLSDSRFAQKHAEMSEALAKGMVWRRHRRSSEFFAGCRVITTSQYHLKSSDIASLFHKTQAKAYELDHQLFGRQYYHIVGSCHGLVCVYADVSSLYLWNPVLASYSKIPGLDINDQLSSVNVTYGFGYDRCSNDYMILALFRENCSTTACAQLYSTREARWRRVHDLPSAIIPQNSKPGIHVNGSLVWVGSRGEAHQTSTIIVAFDLRSGKFFELPQLICNKDCLLLTLGVLGGCLSMVCYCRRSYAEIWVMKEFGDQGSWTRLVSVPGLVEFCRPLWIYNGAEILMELRSGLFVYDAQKGQFRSLMICGLTCSLNAHVFLETLVSPILPETENSKYLN